MNMMPTMPPQNQEKPAIKHFIDPERYLGVSKETLDINALNPNYPQKVISNDEDVETWLNSIAFHRFMRFIIKCNYSVRNLKISDVKKMKNESKILDRLNGIFDQMSQWIKEIPLKDMALQRFGNLAFRDWHDRLEKEGRDLVLSVVEDEALVPHILAYFMGAFGDKTRIDYGSGHEASFIAFLCCLDLVDLISELDYPRVVLDVFVQYLKLVRMLQETYRLEPAGSRGVWGLDDYQFMPFLWGSAQLLDHARIQPKSIMNQDIVSTYASEYLYLSCISFITRMKQGPFFEHSPMLYDISGVPNWHKVNGGMVKMYLNEVLCKLPVIQHFPFGQMLPFERLE